MSGGHDSAEGTTPSNLFLGLNFWGLGLSVYVWGWVLPSRTAQVVPGGAVHPFLCLRGLLGDSTAEDPKFKTYN